MNPSPKNTLISKNRGKNWKKGLREGKLNAMMSPTALRVHRVGANMTQAELAKKAGINPSTYTGIETGKRLLKMNKAKAIGKALKVTLSKLFKTHGEDKLIAIKN